MGTHTRLFGTLASLIALVCAFNGWAQEAEAELGAVPSVSGRGTVSLSPAQGVQEDGGGSDERWEISFKGVGGEGVKGTVRIGGISVPQAGDVGEIDWTLSGPNLSGTVTNPAGGGVLASFNGTVSANGIQGTFTIVDGPSGSWAWEGALPQPLPAPNSETTP